MTAHPPLLRRYRKSLIAVLIFVAYALALLLHNLDVRQRLQQNLLDAARIELARQADALSYFFFERRNDIADLAASPFVASYFAGRDLGMSTEYGQGIHIQAIEDKFTRTIAQKRRGTAPIYTQFVLIDERGLVIGQSGTSSLQRPEDFSALASAPQKDAPVKLVDDGKALRFTHPVVIKGQLRGHILSYTSLAAVELRAGARTNGRPEALVVSATGSPVLSDPPALFAPAEVQRILAGPDPGDAHMGMTLPGTGDEGSADTLIAALKQGIEGSPFALVELITERELAAHSIPPLVILALGTVPLVVVFIMLQEMRERRRTEEAHASARAAAEKLAQARSDFLSNMSHEIRTPLNAIIGLAEMGWRSSAGRRAAQQFSRIVDAGQHLLGLINDVLDRARIEAGKLKVESVPIEPAKIIDAAITLTAERAFASGLRFVVRESGLPARCHSDALRLSQVLVNLLGNAIKFTEAGEVTLDARVQGDWLCFAVGDTGIGMTPEQVARLFRPFEQADSSTTRRFGGTGLGLSISAHLVEAMGGHIQVDSAPGVGSRFEVRLPLLAAEADSRPAPQGRIVLAGLPTEEATPLLADLAVRGIPASKLDAPGAPPSADALVVIDLCRLEGPPEWRDWLEALQDSGQPVALVGRIGETGLSDPTERIAGQLPLIERPLRSRHLVEHLRDGPARPAASRGPLRARLAGIRVLAVDDNEINRLLLADLLAQEGARIECLESGADVLAHLQQVGTKHYELVLTDVQMPAMDGYELTRHLHELDGTLPVLGLTAHAGAEAREQCIAAGMCAHLPKPIEVETLVEAILQCRRTPDSTVDATGIPAQPSTAARPMLTPTPANQPLIDWPALNTQFKGRDELVSRLATKALASYRSGAARLHALADGGDSGLPEVAFLAHSIKGTAGAMQIAMIHELAAATDKAARTGDASGLRLAGELAAGLDRVIVELEARTGA